MGEKQYTPLCLSSPIHTEVCRQWKPQEGLDHFFVKKTVSKTGHCIDLYLPVCQPCWRWLGVMLPADMKQWAPLQQPVSHLSCAGRCREGSTYNNRQ